MTKKYVDEHIKEKAKLESIQHLILYTLEKKTVVSDEMRMSITSVWNENELMSIYDVVLDTYYKI